jgi:AraC-like DNA-binding protein
MLIPSSLLDRHGSFYRSFMFGTIGWDKVSLTHKDMFEDAVFGIGCLQKSGTGADSHDMDPAHYSAIYVLSGRGTYRDSTGATGVISPGTVFQRLCGRKHTAIFDPSVRYVEMFLAFSPWMMAPVNRILHLEEHPVVQAGIDLALIRDLSATMDALQVARERELPRVYLQCLGLLSALFTTTGQASDGEPVVDWIDEACRLLADEADERFPLAGIAKRLGMGYDSFRKEFRARMGVSPGDYRIRRRIDRARELLTSTTQSVKEIAYELGYPNPSVFSLQFKREVGRSPEHYRSRGN